MRQPRTLQEQSKRGLWPQKLSFDPGADAAIAVLARNYRSLTTESIGKDVVSGCTTPFDVGPRTVRTQAVVRHDHRASFSHDPFRSRSAPDCHGWGTYLPRAAPCTYSREHCTEIIPEELLIGSAALTHQGRERVRTHIRLTADARERQTPRSNGGRR